MTHSIPDVPRPEISWDDFQKVDVRIGTIISVRPNAKARKPAFVLEVDLGPIGILQSSAQLTQNYSPESLLGRQVAAVVNFPTKIVAGVNSQCLILAGVSPVDGTICLTTMSPVQNGTRVA